MAACEVKVCRICFTMDCELLHLHENMNLYKGYEAVTGLMLADEEDLPPYLCMDCADQLMNCTRFRHRSLQAHVMLLDILKNHECISVESIQTVIKTTRCGSDIEHAEGRTFRNFQDEIKYENIPGDSIAELSNEIKTEYMPDVGADDVANVVVKEEVFEASDSGNVDDSELGTVGEDGSLDDGHLGQEDTLNKIEVREGTEIKNGLMQTESTEVIEKLKQNGKLSGALCNYANDNKTQALSPLKAHAEELHYCYVCDFKTESKKKILAHMTSHIDTPRSNNVDGRYSNKNTQSNHLRSNPSKNNMGETCKQTIRSKNGYKRHMLTHTGDKPYSCDVCKNAFSSKLTLKNHMLLHSTDKRYKCNVCDKSYYQKGSFEYHLLTHLGDRPYRCNICKSSFTKKGSLKSHMLVHSGDKPYKCDVCQKTFSQKCNLQNHLHQHFGHKPFACELCKKSFSRKFCWQNHMLIHSGDKPYSCDVCNKSFLKKSNFKRHLLTHSVNRSLVTCK